ncbi:HSP20-like chaperone [Basidiobolus meristosporus CBS 931.73]|uniref:HSP20-like chaperone n=1 Tax=Basidiobolus meristosporus CBS 931.73 TaxID=1314790 RepID=A0A1Y1Y6U0_9FUNG|nr:HSP20-like chaperone [Basidiobolus meristosporus CBS 931.73]|eukprot:ORX93730.1 HSP20-like chaperone [Basidiobolus meristosporus CBS 931.73]
MFFPRRFAAALEHNHSAMHPHGLVESKMARKLEKHNAGRACGFHGWNQGPFSKGPQPRANLAESPSHYSLEVELPGLNKENIDLELVNDKVAILRGEFGSANSKVKETIDQLNTPWAQGRLIGAFERTFVFPDRFNLNEVKATMKDGLLKVEFPKHSEDILKVKAINIE